MKQKRRQPLTRRLIKGIYATYLFELPKKSSVSDYELMAAVSVHWAPGETRTFANVEVKRIA